MLLIHGQEVITLSGSKQMKIIESLVAGLREGRRRSTATLLEEAGSESGSLPRAFGKKWRHLRPVPSRVVLEFGVDAVSGSLRVTVQAARSIC